MNGQFRRANCVRSGMLTRLRWLRCLIWLGRLSVTFLLTLGLLATVGLLAGGLKAQEVREGARLLQKLRERQPVKIVALGDSITFGIGLSDPQQQSYYTLFRRALAEAFNNPKVSAFAVADPGIIAGEAVTILDSHVLTYRPDLVVVQLGGNDVSRRTDGFDFQNAMQEILKGVRDNAPAKVILCVPPLENKPEDHRISRIIRAVAVEAKVALADFDTMLRQRGYDYRGPFAWRAHPNEYVHALMAKELLRTFYASCGIHTPLRLEIERQVSHRRLGGQTEVVVTVENLLEKEQACELLVAFGAETKTLKLDLPAHGKRTVQLPHPLPANLPMFRSQRSMLWALARSEEGADFDTKWLTVSPLLIAKRVTPPAPEEEKEQKEQKEQKQEEEGEGAGERDLPIHREWGIQPVLLSAEHLVIGRNMVTGPQDLEARVYVYRQDDTLHLLLDVTDDKVITRAIPERPHNDCVELFFDARPQAQQGIPYYTPSVFLLFVNPASDTNPAPEASTLDAPPPGLNEAQISSMRTLKGYIVKVSIPLKLFRQWSREELERIGFDIAIDDADSTHGRDSQMVWAGTKNNFVHPSYFAGLSWAPDDLADTVKVTVH